jgi:hypothetical protein
MTEQDLVNLKRTIYLTIMSSAGFEEATHKLMKLDLKVWKEGGRREGGREGRMDGKGRRRQVSW